MMNDRDNTQNELNRLNRLLYEKDKAFEKAKLKRIIITILGFGVVYFLLLCFIEKPKGIPEIASVVLGAAFIAGLHVWINVIVFSYIANKGKVESEMLDRIRNEIKNLENSNPPQNECD